MNLSKITKTSKKYRVELLKQIIEQIRGGEYRDFVIDPNKLYVLHNSVRHEYQHPYEVGGFNYGYMTSGELNTGPFDRN